jgi:Recombinase
VNAVRENKALWGRAPFGYRIVKEGGYKYLEPDPITSEILVQMVGWYLDDGLSLIAIARKLDELGVPTSNETTCNGWAPKIVNDILRSKASLIGRKYNGKGQLVMKYPPMIDMSRWHALQTALDANRRRRGNHTKPKGMLADVARCAGCGRVMHYRRLPSKYDTGYVWVGLRCDGTPKEPSTCRNMIPADSIEGWVNMQMTDPPIGEMPVIETVVVPGNDHADEIEQVEADLHDLDFDDPEFLGKQHELMAERKRLRDLPSEPSRTEEVVTDETVARHWARLDDQERRGYLLRAEATVYATGKDPGEGWRLVVERPNALRKA